MKQQPWTEEQETELQKLFMQNQESPQTDQDVIDWLCENLSGVSRSRRGIIKKLKELGLIFKAPTKRSNAAALNKNLFMEEEDVKLRELYEEHRLETDCLKRILEAFDKKRNKKAIVKRMLQLGLIADESEILPSKKNKKIKEKSREHEYNSNDDDDDENTEESEDDISFTERRSVSKKLEAKHQLKQKEAMKLLNELEESQRDGIQWIIECLNEAAEDFEEISDELDDAIPIVPITQPHREALQNSQFTQLLSSLNLIEPKGQENYWKIPANMIPDELKLRVKILSGENVEEEENKNDKKINTVSGDEDDDDDLFARLRAQRDNLIYNTSDNEEKLHKIPSKKMKKIGKPNTKLIKTLKKIVDKEVLKWLISTLNDKMRNKMTDNVDELLLVPSEQSHQDALKDENFIKLLTCLNLQIPEGIENYWSVPKSMSFQQLKIRTELLTPSDDEIEVDDECESEGEESSDEEMIITRKKKRNHDDVVESENLEISTQALKQRLAELSASSDDDDDGNEHENRSKLIANKRKIMDSSDEDEHNASDQQQRRKSSKRDRSITPDENEMNASNNNSKATKRNRRIVDSSDEE
jgi:timeless